MGHRSALDVAAHRGEPRTEPSDDVEAVQHVAGVGQAASTEACDEVRDHVR